VKKILLLDGYNLLYRARSGYTAGDYAIVYNFFRSFRVLVEKFSPDLAYFALEGRPVDRLDQFPDYKAQRVYHDTDGFQRQKDIIVNLLRRRFPVSVVRHQNYEGDDVLANIATKFHQNDACTVVSSDSDFLQLYDQHKHIEIYNPIKKKVAEKPAVNYVLWKSLRGDPADNIPGFKGVGNKRAARLVEDSEKLDKFLSHEDRASIFERNRALIQFHDMGKDLEKIELSKPVIDWDAVRAYFTQLEFKTITNETSWEKFTQTFHSLEYTD
jgi:DNA polymerase I